jgi:vacuolar-type H+-ATPase subunit H
MPLQTISRRRGSAEKPRGNEGKDMEMMISRLSEIEEKANQIIAKANEHKKMLHEEFEKNIDEMEKAIASDNAQKLRSLQEKTDREFNSEKGEMIANSEKRIKRIEEINQNECDALVKQVFDNIIHS